MKTMLIDPGCLERGCACHDDRTDKDGVTIGVVTNCDTWLVHRSGDEALTVQQSGDQILFTRKAALKKLLTNDMMALEGVTQGQYNRQLIHKQLDDWLDKSMRENT